MRIKHARKGFLVSMSRNEIRTLKLTLNLIDTEDFSRLHGYDDEQYKAIERIKAFLVSFQ